MTRDNIIRMAREAGVAGVTVWNEEKQADVLRPELECLAYSAFSAGVIAEREACLARADIALLGSTILMRDRVLRAIRSKDQI